MKFGPVANFTLLIALVMVWAIFVAMDFPFLARLYPLMAGSFTLVMAILLLVIELRAAGKEKGRGGGTGSGAAIDIEANSSMPALVRTKKNVEAFAWFLAVYLAIWLLGFKIGVLAFLVAYIGLKARVQWFLVLSLLAGLVALLAFFDVALKVYWPSGLLEQWLGERWPWLF